MIYDISMLIHGDMQTYKNNKNNIPVFTTNQNHETGNAHDTTVTLNIHTGTHIDYPLHMIEGGKTTDSENLEPLIGSAKVLDLLHLKDKITKSDLVKLDIKENDFLLFKTINSLSEEFLPEFVYLDESASEFLVSKKVRGAGTDALGIERAQSDHMTHKNLLGNSIVILEGLRLKDVPEGEYELIFLPLKIKGLEGALGRAILRTL